MNGILVTTLKDAVMITVFVLIMMIVIEYINVQSRNIWADRLRNSPLMQIVIAALLGTIPGCMGTFTIVSLYTHRLMGLAGLVTAMIATSGDEAFVMLALFPGKTFLLQGILLVVAIFSGWIVHLTGKDVTVDNTAGFTVHGHENCRCFNRSSVLPQLKRISFERALLILFSLVFIFLLLTGITGNSLWDWKKVTFLSGSLFLLFTFITVPEHFLKEHLYNHILKRHLLRIFLWTWIAFIIMHFIQSNFTLNYLILNNTYFVLLVAVMVGFIPESGPHMLFVTMYAQSLIPFSVLLSNSIVQDGHGMLPLLAESRKDFIKVKAINMITGFVVGYSLLFAGL